MIRYFQTGHFPVPFVALWFSLMGGLALLSQGLKLDYADWSFAELGIHERRVYSADPTHSAWDTGVGRVGSTTASR